jgi:cation diffusion facilitator CzcD-associated flavoprotein CzcO
MELPPRIAVLGAGPIGLEAALYARTLGYPVTVYEKGRIGDHLRAWGHVATFTPWSLNVSPLGLRRLRETESWRPEPDADAFPTGREIVHDYLEPLARLPEMEGSIREGVRVVAVGRSGVLKGDGVGDGSRRDRPFRILLESAAGETTAEADVVLDATGVFGRPNPLGRDGIPAPGERGAGDRIATGLPDVLGPERVLFEGKRILVVGGGLSAATTVCALEKLSRGSTIWSTRGGAPPLAEIAGDSLPARAALVRAANRLARRGSPRLRYVPESSVLALSPQEEDLSVTLDTAAGEEQVVVDRVVAQTGFRPDNRIYRELQVHECYASEGPMKLSASLLGVEGADCLEQTGFGPESLTQPEPGFFIVGHKSYGRNPAFLLRVGREQVRDVFQLVTGDVKLDLYTREEACA